MAAKRKSASDGIVVTSEDEADAALADIAAKRREVERIEGQLNDRVDELKADAEVEAGPLRVQIKAREDALKLWARHNTEALKGKKTLVLRFGRLGFRQSTGLAVQKTTWEQVLGKLLVLGQAVRTKQEVDKDELGKWSAERLAPLGVRHQTKHQFWYELDEQRLHHD
jgi:phage host-nuclease inhibitor protein Gam